MLKKLLLATTVCIALSACNDSSSSSNTEPPEPLATLTFENLSNVSSIARVETSSEDGSHLIGFDANGAPIGDISNMGVEDFTPTSDGGFVVEVSEKHKGTYKYTQGLAPVEETDESATAIKKLIESVSNDKPIVDVTQNFRHPVWYYVNSQGDYYLISNKRNLPSFMGENSEGLLIFSDGETFDTITKRTGQRFNDIELDAQSIIDAISTIKNPDQDDSESIKDVITNLVTQNKIEKTTDINLMNSDSFIAISPTVGSILIESTTSKNVAFDADSLCSGLSIALKPVCKKIVNAINDGLSKITLDTKIKDLGGVSQMLPIPNLEFTLLDTGLLSNDGNLDQTYSSGWSGESTAHNGSSLLLSTSINNQTCGASSPLQCIYSISINSSDQLETTEISSNGFNTGNYEGQIEGGQQNYLWVNDSYIVIKEATQISIIDRADNNKLLDPVLAGTEIDTINLTDDNNLYITATDSSNTPAAYIYNITTDTMSNDISNGEKLHALKALIK